jgi:hypothetical protein
MALVVSTTSKVSSGFDPRTIPDCALWLDAADRNTLTLSGSNVTQWNDKSGNGVNLTAASSNPVYQSNQINGLPGLVFSGSNRLTTSYTYATQTTAFIVYTTSVTNNDARLIDINGNGYGNIGIWYAPGYSPPTVTECGLWVGGSNFPQQGIYTTRAPETGVRAYSILFNGTSSQIWRNGSQETLNATGAGFAGTANGTSISIGGSSTTGSFIGTIGEVLLFKANLTTAQRQQVEGYLARKWGLSSNLPATHLYRSIPIVTRAFQPIDIANCALWLDSADRSTMSLSGSNINSWSDKTSNISFTASSTKPTIYSSTYNGLNPVYFGGSAYLSNGTFSYQLSNRSAFIVCGEVSRTGNGDLGFMSFANSGNDYDRSNAIAYTNGWAPNGKYFAIQAGVYGAVTGGFDATFGSATPTPFAVVGDTFSSGTETVYENGTQRVTSNVGVTFSNSTGLVLGARYLNGSITSNINGVIAEIALFNRALTSSERRQVEGYLAAKWGLRTNLPSTHPFKLVPAITPVFTPLQISGCQLWLDAADATTLTLSGSNVTQWNDKSGNGRNTSTFWNAPTFSNGAVQFNTTQGFSVNLTASSTIESGFVVAGVVDYGQGNTLLGAGNGNGARQFRIAIVGIATVKQDIIGVLDGGTLLPTNTTQLVEFTNDGTTITHYWNGAFYKSGSTLAYDAGRTTTIGQRNGNFVSEGLKGYIQEIIIFNRAVSSSERQQVEGYLAAKWGLKSNLPTTHPFKVITP